MDCPHCTPSNVANRSRLIRLGYKTYFCNNCRRGFNQRTGSPFNRSQIPTEVIFKVVLWRLHFKLSLNDLAQMFLIEGYYFTRETVRLWEEKYAP